MREPLDAVIEAYAKLVVRVGVNVQFGQRVVIRGAVEHAPVARVIAAEAYRAGASHVSIDYTDSVLTRAAVDHAPEASLGRVLPHEVEGIRAWREDRPALITLTGNPQPTVMEGADPARLAASMPMDLMREFLPIISTNLIAWTVVGAPNPAWAQTVFGEPDVDRLWQAVAVAMRLDQDDPVDAWRAHIAKLAGRRDRLNARQFDRIRFRGPGTDLTVGLLPSSTWVSGAMTNADGTEFVANMPTEEVFTSPDWRRADGTLSTTAPFFLMAVNTLVDGLRLELSDGQIRGASADRGEVGGADAAGEDSAGPASRRDRDRGWRFGGATHWAHLQRHALRRERWIARRVGQGLSRPPWPRAPTHARAAHRVGPQSGEHPRRCRHRKPAGGDRRYRCLRPGRPNNPRRRIRPRNRITHGAIAPGRRSSAGCACG